MIKQHSFNAPSLMDYYITASIKDSSEIVANMSKTDAAGMLGVEVDEYVFPESYHRLVSKLSLSLAVSLLNEKGGWTEEVIKDASFASKPQCFESGVWYDIKYAPKTENHTPYVYWCPHSCGGYSLVGFYDRENSCFRNTADGTEDTPTHWMPLPKNPKPL